MEAHTNVDVVVNLQEFKALLDSRLPLVFNGTAVADAELPWPTAGDPSSPGSKVPWWRDWHIVYPQPADTMAGEGPVAEDSATDE